MNPSGEPILGRPPWRGSRTSRADSISRSSASPRRPSCPPCGSSARATVGCASSSPRGSARRGEPDRPCRRRSRPSPGRAGCGSSAPTAWASSTCPEAQRLLLLGRAPRSRAASRFVSQSGAYGGLFFREVRAAIARGRPVPLDRQPVRPRLRRVPRTGSPTIPTRGWSRSSSRESGTAARSSRPPGGWRARSRSSRSRAARGTRRAPGGGLSHRARWPAPARPIAPRSARRASSSWRRPTSCSTRWRRWTAHGGRLPRDATRSRSSRSRAVRRWWPPTPRRPPVSGARRCPTRARRALRAHLPDFGADGNPVDMTPQMEPGGFEPSVRLVLDGARGLGRRRDRHRPRPAGVRATRSPPAQAATGKPVVACTVDTPEMDARLSAAGIPLVPGTRARRASVPGARPSGPSRRERTEAVAAGARAGPAARARRAARRRPGGRSLMRDGARASGALRGAVPSRTAASPRRRRPCRPPRRSATLWSSRRRARTCSTGPRQAASCSASGTRPRRERCDALEARLGPGPPPRAGGSAAGTRAARRWPARSELRTRPCSSASVACWPSSFATRRLGSRPLRARRRRARWCARDGGRRFSAGFAARRPSTTVRAGRRTWSAVGDLLEDHPEVEELDLNPLIASGRAARGRGRARPGESSRDRSQEDKGCDLSGT